MSHKSKEAEDMIVKCSGGGALGHPVIYLNLGDKGKVVCPYCLKSFVKRSIFKGK